MRREFYVRLPMPRLSRAWRARGAMLGILAIWAWLGCASAQARDACVATPLARLAVRNESGFIVLQATIGAVPVSLLLDTGAETGLILPQAAQRLHLPIDHSRRSVLEGTGGGGRVGHNVVLSSLTLGNVHVTGMSLPVGALPAIPQIHPPVAGLLGADLFARFDILLDLGHGALALYPPGCVQTAPFDGAVSLPVQRLGPRMAVQALLNGLPLMALLDTGARSIVVAQGVALDLGITLQALADDQGGVTGGVDLRDVPFHWHKFDSLQLGPEKRIDPILTVTELHDQTPMLVGSDWFIAHRVWLSWSAAQMWFAVTTEH